MQTTSLLGFAMSFVPPHSLNVTNDDDDDHIQVAFDAMALDHRIYKIFIPKLG
jgi:hypothetical protein